MAGSYAHLSARRGNRLVKLSHRLMRPALVGMTLARPLAEPRLDLGEPRATGIASSAGRVHLVIVAGAADYGHVAKLIHARDLMRADPDYAEHRGKRVSMILLANKVEPAIADFAPRHRVRISVPVTTAAAEAGTLPASDRADAIASDAASVIATATITAATRCAALALGIAVSHESLVSVREKVVATVGVEPTTLRI
jgi:hypothetical protein